MPGFFLPTKKGNERRRKENQKRGGFGGFVKAGKGRRSIFDAGTPKRFDEHRKSKREEKVARKQEFNANKMKAGVRRVGA